MNKRGERGVKETVRASFLLFSELNRMLLSLVESEDGHDGALHMLLQHDVSARQVLQDQIPQILKLGGFHCGDAGVTRGRDGVGAGKVAKVRRVVRVMISVPIPLVLLLVMVMMMTVLLVLLLLLLFASLSSLLSLLFQGHHLPTEFLRHCELTNRDRDEEGAREEENREGGRDLVFLFELHVSSLKREAVIRTHEMTSHVIG
jgi:hypothetical protein